VEPLFLFAALLQQPRPLGSRPVLDSGLFQGQVEEDVIHIIPAELRDPVATDHLVAASRHTDNGRIEGATTEIIHHDEFAPGAGTRTAGMMGIFDARRGRLIEELTYLKAGVAEGLQREETLVAVGIGRDGDHGLQGFLGPEAQVGACDEVTPQLRQERSEQLQGNDCAAAQCHCRRGS